MRWVELGQVYVFARRWLWVSLIIGLWCGYEGVVVQEFGVATTAIAFLTLFFFGLWANYAASATLWGKLRGLVGILPSLIVASTLIFGYIFAEPVVWLPTGGSKYSRKTAMVVLLLDELNAQASQGLQRVLVSHGLTVSYKPVTPAYNSTAEVVPVLFADKDFRKARACGLSRICAQTAVLDFSKIEVRRNDVDVVGFFQPYCAIQGLRYCKRSVVAPRAIFDGDRWACAAVRLSGVQIEPTGRRCQERSHEAWQELRDQVLASLWRAPTLLDGGVLFAHLPLPHPPAQGTGSIAEQYSRNLQLTENILSDLLDQFEKNEVEPQIIIFSDHPLRQAMWCARESAQFDSPCVISAALTDDQVPLIVASRSSMPRIEEVESNREVFDVLRQWLSE